MLAFGEVRFVLKFGQNHPCEGCGKKSVKLYVPFDIIRQTSPKDILAVAKAV